jgi:hypothetical protein
VPAAPTRLQCPQARAPEPLRLTGPTSVGRQPPEDRADSAIGAPEPDGALYSRALERGALGIPRGHKPANAKVIELLWSWGLWTRGVPRWERTSPEELWRAPGQLTCGAQRRRLGEEEGANPHAHLGPHPSEVGSRGSGRRPSSPAVRETAPAQRSAVRLQTVRGIAGELPLSSSSGGRDDPLNPAIRGGSQWRSGTCASVY